MSGPLASVAPGAGIRGVPNPNNRRVNDIASGQAPAPGMNLAQSANPPPTPGGGGGSIPPALLAMMAVQQPQQPLASPMAGRIPLAPGAPSIGRGVPAMPTVSPAAQGPQDAARLFGGSLAQKGRNGDNAVAHVQTGEIVIPLAAQSPALMGALAQVFTQNGLDIRQFVVGSQHAKKNPHTGLHEFNSGMMTGDAGLASQSGGMLAANGIANNVSGTPIGAQQAGATSMGAQSVLPLLLALQGSNNSQFDATKNAGHSQQMQAPQMLQPQQQQQQQSDDNSLNKSVAGLAKVGKGIYDKLSKGNTDNTGFDWGSDGSQTF